MKRIFGTGNRRKWLEPMSALRFGASISMALAAAAAVGAMALTCPTFVNISGTALGAAVATRRLLTRIMTTDAVDETKR